MNWKNPRIQHNTVAAFMILALLAVGLAKSQMAIVAIAATSMLVIVFINYLFERIK